MSEHAFKVGSIVTLKSGGPRMTVTKVDGETVLVFWFSYNRDQFHDATFPADSLDLLREKPVSSNGETDA